MSLLQEVIIVISIPIKLEHIKCNKLLHLGREDIVQTLLLNGWNASAVNEKSMTPLHYAAHGGN